MEKGKCGPGEDGFRGQSIKCNLSPNGCRMGDSRPVAYITVGGCPDSHYVKVDQEKKILMKRHLTVGSASSPTKIDNCLTMIKESSDIECEKIITARPYTATHEDNLSCKPPRIDLLLVGKTGNGKSATGNCILRKRTFESGSTTSSLAKKFYSGTTEHKGRPLKVVDGLTVCDTRLNRERSVEQTTEVAKLALAANPDGYHAFLLVLKYGNRFTREEKDSVDTLKQVFGDNFLRKYAICILTSGDIFKQEHRGKLDKRKTFPQWCEKQDGAFKELLEECDNRIILFDNNTEVEQVIVKQIDALINKVDELLSARRYTNKIFERVKKTKTNIITKPIQNLIQDEIEARPEVELTQVTNSRIQNENLVSGENCISQSMPITYSPLDCPASPPKLALVLEDVQSEEYENLIKELELIKKKHQEIEENYQKKIEDMEQRLRDKDGDYRETTVKEERQVVDQPQVSNETVDLVTLDKMMSQTNTVQVILTKQEECFGALQELAQSLESLHKQVSGESVISRRCIEEIQQSRQQEEEMKQVFDKELKNQREDYENQIEDLKRDEQQRKEIERNHQKGFEDLLQQRQDTERGPQRIPRGMEQAGQAQQEGGMFDLKHILSESLKLVQEGEGTFDAKNNLLEKLKLVQEGLKLVENEQINLSQQPS